MLGFALLCPTYELNNAFLYYVRRYMTYFRVKRKTFDEIEAKYICVHEHREIRRRIINDGRPSYVSQCICCGHTSSPIKVKEALAQTSGKAIPEYDYLISDQRRTAKYLEYQEAYLRLKPELRREYEEYLRSDLWKEIRTRVIARAVGLCEICKENSVEEVHHMTYERIGSEVLEDLLGVCSICHKIIHEMVVRRLG